MKKILILALALTVTVTASWLYLGKTYPTTSPLKSYWYFLNHLVQPHARMEKEAYGFLPYWQVKNTKNLRFDILTEINYFGLTVDENGDFIKVTNNETDPGFREWESETIKDLIAKTQIMGGKFSITIISQRNTTIEAILDDKDSQQKLIANIVDQVKSRNLNGVNIDFEYDGTPDKEYKDKFTRFSKKLKESLSKTSLDAKLALSIMPLAGRHQGLFDLPKIVPVYDKFIGMSYDYIGISSEIAGPPAPMKGFSENKFFFDVTTTYNDYKKLIPKEKILMGVPHYGWDWAVAEGPKIQSNVLGISDPNNYAAVMSYGRAKTDKNLKKDQCKFDDYAMQPWCWYTDKKTGTDHQVWFEDNKSLGIKYDYAKKQNFSGIAIWVLGYDKDFPDLWNMMKDKFSK